MFVSVGKLVCFFSLLKTISPGCGVLASLMLFFFYDMNSFNACNIIVLKIF